MYKNFLPQQYEKTNSIPLNHNYLSAQFHDHDIILEKIKKVVLRGDFTLGRAVDEFEEEFSKVVGVKHAIGVGSGTDAIFLSLKMLGIGHGDEVITTPFTFYATIGAIVTAGAKPVFVDIGHDYNIDADKIENAITKHTKAIVPVHWSGLPCNMDKITKIASSYNLKIVEDACHAINATYKNIGAGSFGDTGCFSLHPLKNLNVWGDGGLICTNSDEHAENLRKLRNHGLSGRDECQIFAYNSRLDTIQAVIGSHLITKISHITDKRIQNAMLFDDLLSNVKQIKIPKRDKTNIRQVFHIYSILAENRDHLQAFLIERGVDAKVHYPVPMHLQPAANYLGHQVGDFPVAELVSGNTISLPVHEFISADDCVAMAAHIRDFYK